MRPAAIKIHNFRNFPDAEINLRPYTLLAGANNSGKSNLIDAVRVFYEKDNFKYDASRDFPKFDADDQESWIEIQFRPSGGEYENLKDDYRLPDGTFRVRKYLQSSEEDDDGKKKSGIYAYEGGELSGNRFYGAKNVQQGKFGDVIFVPAVSKLDEHTKLTGPSALRDLINAVFKRVIGNSSAYTSLKDAFDEFGSGLKNEQTDDGQSLGQLESEITEEIAEWGAKFQLLIRPLSPDELVKSLVDHQVWDEALGQSQDSNAYGQGFQRHLIFTLIRLAARYSAAPTAPSRKEFSPRLTWILFEEPEAFLHPSQIDTLEASLREICEGDENQVLISTHNPQFVSKSIEELPALVRLHRNGAKATVSQVDSARLDTIISMNQEDLQSWEDAGILIHDNDMQAEMESIKYALWLNPLRCAAFFANKVLLVEGRTETALIGYLMADGTIAPPQGGVFLLDTLGKYNMHRFMNLFCALGIEHAVLFDYDGSNKEHAAIRKTIEASRNECTIGIDHFDKDIETFLGIPKTNGYRKPQHAMWCLNQGKIENARLESLAAKVTSLLGP